MTCKLQVFLKTYKFHDQSEHSENSKYYFRLVIFNTDYKLHLSPHLEKKSEILKKSNQRKKTSGAAL